MSLKFVQTGAISLYTGLSAAGTSMIVTPYPRDIQTNTKLVFSDFGTTPSCTIDPKIPGYEEICTFTGITDNGDNTATLIGLVRNLIGQYPYTTPGTGKQHGPSAIIVFSDNPQLYARLASLENDNVFTGDNTAPNPQSAQSLVTRDWILALINGGAITQNALVEAGIAGETISTGQLIYFNETENEWMKTAGATLATLFNVKLGIAQGSGTDGVAITDGVFTRGLYTTSGLTQGDLCYASNTAGGINSGTSGTVPRVIGIAKDSTHLYFDPDFQNKLYDYVSSVTGNDTYLATMPGALSVPYTGMRVKVKVDIANTGACSFNGVTIKKSVSVDTVTGDILANQIIELVYDGTNYQIVSMLSTASAPSSFVGAPVISNTSSSTQNVDTVFTPNFTAKVITLYFKIDGFDPSNTTRHSSGIATFDGTSLTAVMYFNQNQNDPTVAFTFGGLGIGSGALTCGNGATDGMTTALSVFAVTSTTFTVRITYTTANGKSGTCSFYPVAIQ
jgi:hypothetical protein